MNKKLGLLSSVAAAILLSAGIASAQSMNKDSNNTPTASEMHQSKTHKKQTMGSAQNESSSKTANSSSDQAMKQKNKAQTTGQASSDQTMKKQDKTQASEESKGNKAAQASAHQKKSEITGEANANEATKQKNKAATSGQASNNGKASKQENKAQTTGQAPSANSQAKEQQNNNKKNETTGQANANSKANEHQGQNNEPMNASNAKPSNGQQANNKARPQGVNLSEQQQTKVERTVFSQRNVPRENNVNFSINVGTPVPHRVRAVVVPETLVSIHPQWRGDDYFVARDEIIVIDHDRKIVAVIPTRNYEASASTTITISSLPAREIRDVQTALIDRGYLKNGQADGVFGPKTESALISFQRHAGLRPSGKLNHRTIASLGLSDQIDIGTVGQGQ